MLKPLLGFSFGWFPVYQIMLCAALLFGWIVFRRALKREAASKFVKKRLQNIFTISTVCGICVANVANWFIYDDMLARSLYHRITQGGFTFYFGMLAFLGVAALLLRLYKMRVGHSLNLIMPPLMMALFLCRLGCCLKGCCWGESLVFGEVSIPFPARELEAIFALVMFIVFSKKVLTKRVPIFFLSYSLLRFITEFFRGDDRGSLFGIDFLTPTQLLSVIAIVISAVYLFTRPALKRMGKEEKLDNLQNKIKGSAAKIKNKIFPKTAGKVYEPYGMDYEPENKKKSPVKIIILIVTLVLIAFALFVYVNPFHFAWCDNWRYAFNEAISFIYEEKGIATETGNINSMSVLELSDNKKVKNQKAALSLLKSFEDWSDYEFSVSEPQKLKDGNCAYVFQQTINGKPVMGSKYALITDANGKALYIAGDSASLSYTTELASSYTQKGVTVAEAFGNKVTVLSSKEYFYDTGRGLVEVYHQMLTDDGKTAQVGAIVRKSNNKIICYTEPIDGMISSYERVNVQSAVAEVYTLLDKGNTKKILKLSKEKIKGTDIEKENDKMVKALCAAYVKSDMSVKQFKTALKSAEQIAENIPNLNMELFGEIVEKEAENIIKKSGSSAKKQLKAIEKAFSKNGFKPKDDSPAVELTAGERKSNFRYSLDFYGDTDVYSVVCEKDHNVNITVDTPVPVYVELCGQDGNAIISTYIDDNETIPLTYADGKKFTLRITDSRLMDEFSDKTQKYKISLQSEAQEDNIPSYIKSTLVRITDAYDRSNLAAFISLCAGAEGPASTEETIALGIAAPVLDSCMSSCSGTADTLDSAKSLIATALLPNSDDFKEIENLKGTTMELSYFAHRETESGTLVKARICIKMDGLKLYDGFTFIKLEHIEGKTPETDEEKALAYLFRLLRGSDYYITDSNKPEFYEAFGDPADGLQFSSEIESLYDFCSDVEEEGGGYLMYYTQFNDELALLAGYSADTVDGFSEYITRLNLTSLRQQKQGYEYQRNLCRGTESVGKVAIFAFDMCTSPVTTIVDTLAEQNKYTDSGWTLIKLIVNPYDTFKDEVVDGLTDTLFDGLSSEAQRLDVVIAIFDNKIKVFTKELNRLKAS